MKAKPNYLNIVVEFIYKEQEGCRNKTHNALIRAYLKTKQICIITLKHGYFKEKSEKYEGIS